MQSAFRALADPSRREILALLRGGSRTSGEIAQHFTTSWATISRHLAVLREAELILAEREGQFIRYELNTTVFQDVIHHLLGLTNGQSPIDGAGDTGGSNPAEK
ncbi:MAG TPA: autorepressor SdpR family transcription factor [Gemmatimonadaceae bacterium]|nr:autorepressor SdpR family transcription factor [Gemmatimonadaceae bacterium]